MTESAFTAPSPPPVAIAGLDPTDEAATSSDQPLGRLVGSGLRRSLLSQAALRITSLLQGSRSPVCTRGLGVRRSARSISLLRELGVGGRHGDLLRRVHRAGTPGATYRS